MSDGPRVFQTPYPTMAPSVTNRTAQSSALMQ